MEKIQVHISQCWKNYAERMKQITAQEVIALQEYAKCIQQARISKSGTEACQEKQNNAIITYRQAQATALQELADCSAKSSE